MKIIFLLIFGAIFACSRPSKVDLAESAPTIGKGWFMGGNCEYRGRFRFCDINLTVASISNDRVKKVAGHESDSDTD